MITSPRLVREIERVGPQLFSNEVLRAGEPVVIRKACAQWPIMGAAREGVAALSAYLKGFSNGTPLQRMVGPPEIAGRLFYDGALEELNFASDLASLDESIAQIADVHENGSGHTIYVGANTIDDILPGLKAHLAMPYAPKGTVPNLWMGTPTKVGAHSDLHDNIACPVAGRRRFRLFPPGQVGNLYVGPHEVTPAGRPVSYVPVDNVDHARFPRFQEALAASQEVVLTPGDALFVPALWWHSVESLDPFNLMFNYWWDQKADASTQANGAMTHGMMAIAHLPEAQRRAWQAYFAHYVFRTGSDPAEHIPEGMRGRLGEASPDITDQLRSEIRRALISI